MKTAELEGPLLDYHVALAMGHLWRRPRDEFEGYNAWQAYERAFGNPTPPYSTDWAFGGPVIESQEISVRPVYMGVATGLFFNESASGWEELTGPTMLIAAMRALVAFHFGHDVPDILL